MSIYTLYWIKDPAHKDPWSEGYIGITTQSIEKRFADHKCNYKNHHLRNRCNSDNVVIVALFENLDRKQATKLEREYRPKEHIGWNIAPGGDIPPPRKGKPAIGNMLLKGDMMTEAQKLGHKKQGMKIVGNSFRKGKFKKTTKKITINCIECGKERVTWNHGAKYCSRKCAGANNKDPAKRAILSMRAIEQHARCNYKSNQ